MSAWDDELCCLPAIVMVVALIAMNGVARSSMMIAIVIGCGLMPPVVVSVIVVESPMLVGMMMMIPWLLPC